MVAVGRAQNCCVCTGLRRVKPGGDEVDRDAKRGDAPVDVGQKVESSSHGQNAVRVRDHDVLNGDGKIM